MLNQVVLVGRLTSDLKVVKSNGKEKVTLILAVPRSYKNAQGQYDTDFIKCYLWNSIATNTAEYCKKGDIVGVKGRIESNGKTTHILAEKVTFLSSRGEK